MREVDLLSPLSFRLSSSPAPLPNEPLSILKYLYIPTGLLHARPMPYSLPERGPYPTPPETNISTCRPRKTLQTCIGAYYEVYALLLRILQGQAKVGQAKQAKQTTDQTMDRPACRLSHVFFLLPACGVYVMMRHTPCHPVLPERVRAPFPRPSPTRLSPGGTTYGAPGGIRHARTCLPDAGNTSRRGVCVCVSCTP